MKTSGSASRREFLGAIGGRGQTPSQGKGQVNPGADNVIVPPFAVRVLSRMGFGFRRKELITVGGSEPGFLFASGFETPTSEFAGTDDIAHFNSLGNTDDERLANYVEEQLDVTLDDPELDERMDAVSAEFPTLRQSLSAAFSTRECSDFSTYDRPRIETQIAAFNRAVYSRRQLFELIVDFWHNHLNVFAPLDRDTQAAFQSWDRDIIRARAFGNYYQMLLESAKHPVMLRYLDNYRNVRGGFNENYARELLELHTMGAENYGGPSAPIPSQIPVLPENPYTALNDSELDAIGYSDPLQEIAAVYYDDDVYSAAQALTGWRFEDLSSASPPNCGTGAFFTDEGEHEGGRKGILTPNFSALIPADQPAEVDGRIIIKLVAYHPGTATYIARKLCRRLISDDPPESIVQAAAQTFFDNRLAPKQILRTLRTILLSDEFKDANNWGSKIKRPFEYVVSAMRAGGLDYTFAPEREGVNNDFTTTERFLNEFDPAGQELFNWRTPDGYPDRRDHWQGSTSLVRCWRTIDFLVDRNDNDRAIMRILQFTLANISGDPTPRQIVEFWLNWLCGFSPDGGWTGTWTSFQNNPPTVLGGAALRFFTQQNVGPNADPQRFYPEEAPISRDALRENDFPHRWNERLRGLVALILWSPQFMQR